MSWESINLLKKVDFKIERRNLCVDYLSTASIVKLVDGEVQIDGINFLGEFVTFTVIIWLVLETHPPFELHLYCWYGSTQKRFRPFFQIKIGIHHLEG